jgi:hypothetical protein
MGEYTPSVPPQVAEDLLPFLNEELVRIAQASNNLSAGFWEIAYKLPQRVRPGLIKYFDGVNADPLGLGLEGLYYYNLAGEWVYVPNAPLPPYTLAGLPSAATNTGLQVYVSDLSGQPAPCFSDGTNWRRVSDNTVAS